MMYNHNSITCFVTGCLSAVTLSSYFRFIVKLLFEIQNREIFEQNENCRAKVLAGPGSTALTPNLTIRISSHIDRMFIKQVYFHWKCLDFRGHFIFKCITFNNGYTKTKVADLEWIMGHPVCIGKYDVHISHIF